MHRYSGPIFGQNAISPVGCLHGMIATTPSLFDALAATPLLAGLHRDALALLAEEGVVRYFEPGQSVVEEGDSGHSLFVILEGDVEVIKNLGRPHSVTLARLHQGTFFGEMCVVDPVPRAATVRTLSPVQVVEISAATLHHLFQKMPDEYAIVVLNLARDLARRLRTLDEAFAARAG